MNKIIPVLILLAVSFFTACTQEKQGNTAQTDSPKIPPGLVSEEKAMEVIENATFTDLEGNEVNLDNFKGKVVLIDFWETWCGPCLQVFPAMDQLREEYPDKFTVLAVTVGLSDTIEDAKGFVAQHDYDFHFLMDTENIFDKVGGQGIPFKILIDPDGDLIEIEMGSRGTKGDYNKAKSLIRNYL